jgi:hypothetical protein
MREKVLILLGSLIFGIAACGDPDPLCELPTCSEIDRTGQQCRYPDYAGKGVVYREGGFYTCQEEYPVWECRCKAPR